jgi:hypothetical protein
MPGGGPSPETTVALIFGASRWPDCPKFQDAPSLERSADAFIQFLQSEQGLGVPHRNIKSLFNSYDGPAEQLDQARIFVDRRRREAVDERRIVSDLIIYYTGHGDFEGEGRDFYLTIRQARPDHPLLTNITIRSFGNWMRQTVRDLRAYLIIDCCFAAAVQHGFLSNPLGLAELRLHEALPDPSIFKTDEELPTSGVALLAASGVDDPASAPPNERLTRFTTALLDVLHEGHERFPRTLSLSDVHELVDRRITQTFPDEARPELRSLQQTRGRVELVRLFPNPATRFVEQKRQAEQRAREAEEQRRAKQVAREAEEKKRQAKQAEEKHRGKSDSPHLLFISHKQEDAQFAKNLRRIFEQQTANIRCYVSEDLGPAMNYRDQIFETFAQANSLILLYLDEEGDWGWCLYETGLFAGLDTGSGKGTKKIICLHHTEGLPPDPIAHLQSVKLLVADIEVWLQDLYRDAKEPPSRREKIPDIAKQICGQLHKRRRTLFSEKNRALRLIVPDRSKMTSNALPLDAYFQGAPKLMGDIFGTYSDRITWGNLKQLLDQSPYAAVNELTIAEISRALYRLSYNNRIWPLQGVLFENQGAGPRRWRPILYRVNEEQAQGLNAEILAVEDFGGQLLHLDRYLRSLLAGIRFGVRLRFELVRPFAGNIQALSRDSYKLRRDFQTCLNNIFIEFLQTYTPAELTDAFDDLERAELKGIIDQIHSACGRLWLSLGFHPNRTFDEALADPMTPEEAQGCAEVLSELENLNAIFLSKALLRVGIMIECELEPSLRRTGQEIGFGFLAKCKTMGLSAVYQTQDDAVDDIVADIQKSRKGCRVYASMPFPELFELHVDEFAEALAEAAIGSSERAAESRYKLVFTCLDWSEEGPKDLLNIWQKRAQREKTGKYDFDWELAHNRFRRAAQRTAERIARKLKYVRNDGQLDLQKAYDVHLDIQQRVFQDYACPWSMCIIDDHIVYVDLYDWELSHGISTPAFRLYLTAAEESWTKIFLNEAQKLDTIYSAVKEPRGANRGM